jgi:hypothetical protein
MTFAEGGRFFFSYIDDEVIQRVREVLSQIAEEEQKQLTDTILPILCQLNDSSPCHSILPVGHPPIVHPSIPTNLTQPPDGVPTLIVVSHRRVEHHPPTSRRTRFGLVPTLAA